MKIISKKIYIILPIIFFTYFDTALASVLFNEVLINPTSNRYIKLYNNSNSEVDLTDWYIQRKTPTSESFLSLISKTNFNNIKIRAGGYIIISKYEISNSDIVYPNLTLTPSNAIFLKNNKGEIVDSLGWGDSIYCPSICPPNPVENEYLLKDNNGVWITSKQAALLLDENNQNESNFNTEIIEHKTETKENTSNIDSSKIITKIISPKIVFANIPFKLKHETTKGKSNKIILGKFVWNFGDGMSRTENVSNEFEYVYKYSGEYVLKLSYYETLLNNEISSEDKIAIKVVEPGIEISSVGTNDDEFVEVYNNSKYEIIIGNFILMSENKSYIFPDGMAIRPGGKIKISPALTGFNMSDLSNLLIIDNNRHIFAKYPNLPNTINKKSINYNNKVKNNTLLKTTEDTKKDEIINLNELNQASLYNKELNTTNIIQYFGIGFIIVTGFYIYYILKKKEDLSVEKEIKAKDIKIIE